MSSDCYIPVVECLPDVQQQAVAALQPLATPRHPAAPAAAVSLSHFHFNPNLPAFRIYLWFPSVLPPAIIYNTMNQLFLV